MRQFFHNYSIVVKYLDISLDNGIASLLGDRLAQYTEDQHEVSQEPDHLGITLLLGGPVLHRI